MCVRLKPLSQEQRTSSQSAAHAVRPAPTSTTVQGDIGGEMSDQAMTPEAQDSRHKVWWAFAHDTLNFQRSVVPQAFGNAHRSRTQDTMDHWFRFMHNSGGTPMIASRKLEECNEVDEAIEWAKVWPVVDRRDSEAIRTFFDRIQGAMRDPRGSRVIQELPAPPLTLEHDVS